MTSELCGRETAVMSEGIEEAELVEIEQRAARAFAIAPTPRIAWLETAAGSAARVSFNSAMIRPWAGSCTSGCTRVERHCLA
jgi:hypothetical protein